MGEQIADIPMIDVEIHVRSSWDQDYPVQVILGGEQVFKGQLSADILPWVPSGEPREDGQRLFDALFATDALRRAWERAQGQAEAKDGARRVRLHIDGEATELHALPWELLRQDRQVSNPLSAQATTPFSRYLSTEAPWGGPVRERPIRALVAISNPDDLDDYNLAPVDVALERQILETAFATADPGELEYDLLAPPVTPERLGEALFDGYHLLHFVGHGAFSARRGKAALYLQDPEGHAQRVLDDQLAELLARQGQALRLVFLAACQSATRSMADAFQGLAPRLVAAGVPAVVAMQDLVTMETAEKFSATFYRQLLKHHQVDLASNEARSALLTAERPDAAVPVLFMRVRDGRLFMPPEREKDSSESPGESHSVNVNVATEGSTISDSNINIGDISA